MNSTAAPTTTGLFGSTITPGIVSRLVLVRIPIAGVVVVHRHDARGRKRHVHLHQLLDVAELRGQAGQEHHVRLVLGDAAAEVEQEFVENVVDDALEADAVVGQVQLLLDVVVAGPAELVARLLQRLDNRRIDDFRIGVRDRIGGRRRTALFK